VSADDPGLLVNILRHADAPKIYLGKTTNGDEMQSDEIGDLVAAIGDVMARVGYVRGTGTNDHHRYNYTSDEDLAAAVQPALVKYGIALFPIACHVDRSGDRVSLVQTWRAAHTSGQWIQMEIAGEGIDKQDKGTAKALTGARKYLLRLLFCIPTGDDIERAAEVAQSNAPREDFSPFVNDLLRRIEALQQAGTPNASAAASKLLAHATLPDGEIRESLEKLIDWIGAAEGPVES